MDSRYAHELYSMLNNDGEGFALTDHENALVVDEIAEAGLTIVADHGDGLLECHRNKIIALVGGDGCGRNAWAVLVSAKYRTEPDGSVYAANADLYEEEVA